MEMYFLLNKRHLRNLFGIIILACLFVQGLVYLSVPITVHRPMLIGWLMKDSSTVTNSSIETYLNTNQGRGRTNSKCEQRLGPAPADDLAKIDSLTFEGIEEYIENLFPPMTSDPDPPKLPVFVTALSSDHYAESLYLFKHLKETVRVRYKDIEVIAYDLGLTTREAKTVKESCSCEVRMFDFDIYPKHVRTLKNYAWKPIVIQTVVKEHPLVFWMDASVRFKTMYLDTLISDVKQYGLMADDTGRRSTSTIAERTNHATFAFLKENPCTYEDHGEKHSELVLVFANQLITKYFMRPWVSCALSFGCMEPMENSTVVWFCPGIKAPHTHHVCHRFDQSILGILYVRLFHREMKYHSINKIYFMFCRYPGMTSNCEHSHTFPSLTYFYYLFQSFL